MKSMFVVPSEVIVCMVNQKEKKIAIEICTTYSHFYRVLKFTVLYVYTYRCLDRNTRGKQSLRVKEGKKKIQQFPTWQLRLVKLIKFAQEVQTDCPEAFLSGHLLAGVEYGTENYDDDVGEDKSQKCQYNLKSKYHHYVVLSWQTYTQPSLGAENK